MPQNAEDARFCCRGCATVYELLHAEGLSRFYSLAAGQVLPVQEETGERSDAWLDALPVEEEGDLRRARLDVQGIHCAACVWLLTETFRRRASGDIVVNPALGTVQLCWREGFDLRAWVREVERCGYRFGLARKEPTRASRELPVRLGVTVALTINVMLFAFSFYAGLSPGDEGFTLFSWLSLGLASLAVGVGGWPFFRAALTSLRNRMLHLDLPIALGIIAVYATSVVQFVATGGRGDAAYFDTLCTFITLMLLGRYLQSRVLERNRRYLLDDGGAEGLLARRVQGNSMELIPAARVQAGDTLQVAMGELLPVAATLLDDEALLRTDWMTGEPEAVRHVRGAALKAGSFNAGNTSFLAEATESFAQSHLVSLLRQPVARDGGAHLQWWEALASRWVSSVLVVSVLGLLLWLPHGFDAALKVMVALLVITCPCAIGLALPLAQELTLSKLRRAGFYARLPDLLDRALAVRHVVFDKTGTLTLGRLEWINRQPLSDEARDIAWNLASRSSHPVSVTLAQALAESGAKYDATARVTEIPGQGVEWRRADGVWRLGRFNTLPLPAAQGEVTYGRAVLPLPAERGEGRGEGPDARGEESRLTRDGEVIATFEFDDVPRPDAVRTVKELTARGYTLWLLSGDGQARVTKLAHALGLDVTRALGGCTPEGKAERIRELGAEHVLYLGDGVNDAPAFEAALLAGTPAIERPVMPARSDFFLVGNSLTPVCEALTAAGRLRRVNRRIAALSLTYNVFAVSAALAGFMSPLAAAISMPASTLTLLLITVKSLASRMQSNPLNEAENQTKRKVCTSEAPVDAVSAG